MGSSQFIMLDAIASSAGDEDGIGALLERALGQVRSGVAKLDSDCIFCDHARDGCTYYTIYPHTKVTFPIYLALTFTN